MKTTKKAKKVTAKKTKKTVSAKVAPRKKVVAKKIAKKPIAKKRAVVKVGRKKIAVDKTLGLFVIVCGILGLVVFAVLGVNSIIAFNQPADDSVLGVFDKAVATPTGLKTSSSDGYTTMYWGKVSNATGYKISRKTGLFGSVSTIYTMNGNINYYTDKTSVPGATYYYGVTAMKGSALSNRSSMVKQVASKLSAPTFSISNPQNSGTALIFSVNMTASGQHDGLNVYCGDCVKKVIEISSASKDKEKYFEYGGRGYDPIGNYGVMEYVVKKLSVGAKYTFQMTKFRIYNGKRYESPKTAPVTATMPAVSSTPSEPAIFQGGTEVGENAVYFTLATSSIRPAGYDLSINCSNNNYAWHKDIPIIATTVNPEGRTVIDTGDTFGNSHGNCTASISAYFLSTTGEKLYSTTSRKLFIN